MGSCSFFNTSANSDARAAYNDLLATARSEFGSDPYNGTISTSEGFRIANNRVMTETEAMNYADGRLDHLSKWDACEAVRVGKPSKTRNRTMTKTIAVDHGCIPSGEIRKAFGLSDAATVEVIEQGPFKVSKKIVKAKTAGAGRKQWALLNQHGGTVATFTKRADAKAALVARFENVDTKPVEQSSFSSVPEAWTIKQVITEPASETWTVETTAKVKIKIRVTEPVEGAPIEFSHWLFYGMAAC